MVQGFRRAMAIAVVLFGSMLVAAGGQTPATAPAPASAPAPTDNGTCASLRAAVKDLSATFGDRYGGDKFLARLDAIERELPQARDDRKAALDKELAALRHDALVANPLVSGRPIVFVVRNQYSPDHHNTATFFPAEPHECNSGSYTPGGALKLLDVASDKAVTLVTLPKGTVRDPDVSFDGKKILFSMRKDPADSYHIYEIDCRDRFCGPAAPGWVEKQQENSKTQPRAAVPRQLTFAKDVDDLDPLYLPDGDIAFSSTREPKYCMCNRHIMANLYRMEADGANIHQIGKSTLFEGHGSLTPDGRILYDRWEYVDRNFGDAQGLWTVNPDGTNHALYWGNNTPAPGAVLDGRVIPGTDMVVCTFAACHDRPWGALAIVDRTLGMDNRPPVVRTWPADAIKLVWTPQTGGGFDATQAVRPKYEDPHPLSDKYFLCSRMVGHGEEMGIFLVDVFGNEILLHSEAPGCFDPMPLSPLVCPPVIPTRRKFDGGDGLFYVQDVYQGTHMAGVKPGAPVKYLRVVETPEKRFWSARDWGGQGAEAPGMNWHDFNNKRILGTVPVEADGSAYFAAPSETFVYFQLLDENHKMIQSMRSGVIVQAGELAGCVGCHENRGAATPAIKAPPTALRRQPSKLQGWYGAPREFNYMAEVQPVLDKNCLRCHDYNKEGAKKLILADDREPCFNASYHQLWTKGYIVAPGAGGALTMQAYSWGSNASKLVKVIEGGHHGVKLDKESFDRIATWIDINAPYYPTYATNFPGNFGGRSPLADAQTERLKKLLGEHWLEVSFDRPQLSPALADFPGKTDATYREALSIIEAGKAALDKSPGADMPGFVPCPLDQWRQEKYLRRRDRELANRKAIMENRKVYDEKTP